MSRYRFLLRHCVHVVVVQSSYRFAVRQIIPAVVVDCVYVTVQNHAYGKRQIVSRHQVFPLLVTYCLLYFLKKTVQVNLQLKIFKTIFTCSSPNLRNCKLDLTFAACLQRDSKSPNYSCCLMRDFRYGSRLLSLRQFVCTILLVFASTFLTFLYVRKYHYFRKLLFYI